MKRVVVTGGTGFIGLHLTDHLRERGFEIHVIGRHRPSLLQAVFHEADILDADRMRQAIVAANASHLLHLAWDLEHGQYWRSPKNLDWIAASLHLVRCFAEQGGARAVIAGTCAEYLWGAPKLAERETLADLQHFTASPRIRCDASSSPMLMLRNCRSHGVEFFFSMVQANRKAAL